MPGSWARSLSRLPAPPSTEPSTSTFVFWRLGSRRGWTAGDSQHRCKQTCDCHKHGHHNSHALGCIAGFSPGQLRFIEHHHKLSPQKEPGKCVVNTSENTAGKTFRLGILSRSRSWSRPRFTGKPVFAKPLGGRLRVNGWMATSAWPRSAWTALFGARQCCHRSPLSFSTRALRCSQYDGATPCPGVSTPQQMVAIGRQVTRTAQETVDTILFSYSRSFTPGLGT